MAEEIKDQIENSPDGDNIAKDGDTATQGNTSGEPNRQGPADLNSIKGVEIFAAGTWNGEKYTTKDLDLMVEAFKDTSNKFRPFLKLGHTDKQKLVQKDGLPAAGFIENLTRIGDKLIADFVDIPKKVFQLLVNKAYTKVSSEIFWNIKFDGRKYNRMLAGVALLGADVPAVDSLNDILAFYGLDAEFAKSYFNNNDVRNHVYEPHKESTMAEKDVQAELLLDEKTKRDAAEAEVKKFKADMDKQEAELAELRKNYSVLKEEKAADEAKAQEQAEEAFLDGLVKDGVVSKAMKPYVKAILGENKKEYSFKKDDKEEVLDKEGMIKQVFELAKEAATVNLDESSVDSKDNNNQDAEDVLIAKAEKYTLEHPDVTFRKALDIVQGK